MHIAYVLHTYCTVCRDREYAKEGYTRRAVVLPKIVVIIYK